MDNYIEETADRSMLDFQIETRELKDRVILISGATGGFGTALSKACSSAGAQVVLVGRKLKKLEKLYDVLIAQDSEPAIVTLEQDKAGPDQYGELADLIEKEFGRLDAVVHTAADLGTATHQMAIDHSEWARVMNVNLTSARLLSLYTLPLLYKSTLASMVFLLDDKTSAYWGTYGVSKQALKAFMYMLADEFDTKHDDNGNPPVAINGYNPGSMRTPLRRRAFPGELQNEAPLPEDKLGPMLYLLSRKDRSKTGTLVNVKQV